MSLNYYTLNNKGTVNSEYLGEDVYNLLDSTFKLPNTGFSFNIFVVSDEYVARPDLVSLDAYNDTRYADILCKINGISNPFELNKGMEIIIPTTNSISSFYSNADKYRNNGFDDESEDMFKAPIEKSKRDTKRKANEAIVGDTRFKVDSAAGIIIY